MSDPLRLSELSPARQALVRLCQSANYAQIEQLQVNDSEPVFNPAPVVLLDLKLDSDEMPRPEMALTDFMLTAEFCRLMDKLDGLKHGIIERIEVRAGLPRRMLFRSKFSGEEG
ncbi:MAG: hypothetical protein ABSG13_25115 [Bryobacteraceae bacterium]